MLKIPCYADKILSKLENSGYEAYVVGGCVRDMLTGRRPGDWDIASSASCDAVMSLFRKTIPTGIKYGTVTVRVSGGQCEVTSFRSDGAYKDGRRPEKVEFIDDITEDLRRRDFTVNAMAMDRRYAITDPFCGREDVERRIIRCVGDPDERFSEDALRMLRAIRFSAVLGFEISGATLDSIRRNSERIEFISPERVSGELGKTLMSKRPWMIKDAAELGLLRKYIKGRVPENIAHISGLPAEEIYRWCALCAILTDCGAIDDTAGFLRSLRLGGAVIKTCEEALSLKLPKDDRGLRVFIADNGAKISLVSAAAEVGRGDAGALRRVRKALRTGNYVSVNSLKISGDELKSIGFTGKTVGEVLRELSHEATLDIVKNKKEDLLERASELKKSL